MIFYIARSSISTSTVHCDVVVMLRRMQLSTDCMKVTARHPPLVTILQSDQTTERGLLKVDTAHHLLLMVGRLEGEAKQESSFVLFGWKSA